MNRRTFLKTASAFSAAPFAFADEKSKLRITSVRLVNPVPRHPLPAFTPAPDAWSTGGVEVASPMSVYPDYKAMRSLFMPDAGKLPVFTVEISTDKGIKGYGQGGPAGGAIVEEHFAKLLIGKDPFDKRKEATNLFQHGQGAIAVLDIGGLDVGRQDHAERIDDDVPLLAFDLLASVVARPIDLCPPFSAALTLWLSMIAAVGLASLPAISRTSVNNAWWRRASVPSHSHSPRYSWTVLLGGRSLGRDRHWQPVIST